MGYQESLIPISHLAEAAGIRDAISKYRIEQDYDYWYYCATRTRIAESDARHPLGREGELYACVGGQRRPYTYPGSRFLDDLVFEAGGYARFFEDLDESLIDEAASTCPEIAKLAREKMERHLAHVWD